MDEQQFFITFMVIMEQNIFNILKKLFMIRKILIETHKRLKTQGRIALSS